MGETYETDSRQNAVVIKKKPPRPANPVVIAVSGLPGTGKTYFSRRLAERLPYTILESDALRKQLFPEPSYTAAESASLFRAIHRRMEELLKKGVSVILDATNLEERHREKISKIAERAGARLILVHTETPPQLVRRRLKHRMKQPGCDDYSDADWAVYQKMKPTEEAIRRRHFTVNTARDIEPALERIVREAERRKEPVNGN